jgi:hypothetical protein
MVAGEEVRFREAFEMGEWRCKLGMERTKVGSERKVDSQGVGRDDVDRTGRGRPSGRWITNVVREEDVGNNGDEGWNRGSTVGKLGGEVAGRKRD